jgi:hypothetical protein
MKADEDGHLPILEIFPAVSGKPGGVCYIDILREKAPIHIKYPWGSEVLH